MPVLTVLFRQLQLYTIIIVKGSRQNKKSNFLNGSDIKRGGLVGVNGLPLRKRRKKWGKKWEEKVDKVGVRH